MKGADAINHKAPLPWDSQGFTLVELVIAMGISAVLTIGIIQLSEIIQRSTKKAEESILQTSQEIMVGRILQQDLLGAQYSLGNATQLDDQQLSFFDHKVDGLCLQTDGTCSRNLTLSMPSKEGDFSSPLYLIIVNSSNKGGLPKILRPEHAYQGDNYQGLNYGQGGESEAVQLSLMEDTPWRYGNLLVVYNPEYVYRTGRLPRQIAIMGWVPEDDQLPTAQLVADNRYYQGVDIRSGAKIVTAQDLFQNMPYEPSLASYIKVVAVKVIRYRLKAAIKKRQLTGKLMRAELLPPSSGKKEWRERLIASDIKDLKFYRESISSPSIGYTLNYFK
ncbi:MAG: prepilin-type N-terminal cleavage/methylation domain-containing protein [Bdellovibrionales bacterium]|jgi:prepilin-type N-terminal cleavage/methylation domain-containing protein|nr:prepilin-type N-terminal cleavage/methylation domain-containing protein [Bdellovibrionales bacterium]MBT3525429.1 prepilin-type N-terminal cleavage/methylation domain-containing protein [Bdellovibrionales bacterium]MBT7668154.1 prepilin-type N-terminal cleavage/methylation domain-containing protein [Bdellovibrionales bacterium]MBT7766970.1 prepilin-type N-terminal cleavage/methylation domain-containing protein [Bdellovibrionales bacterium]